LNILHIASEYPPQEVFGLGRYVSELSHELVRQGHTVHVLTNSIGGYEQDYQDQGASVHRVDYPPPPKPPGNVAPALAFNVHLLQRAIQLGFTTLGSPDVIVSHDWLTATASHHLSQLWNRPHVWTVHDTVRGKLFDRLDDPHDQLTVSLERWSALHADLVVVNSQSVGNEIVRDGGEPDQLRIVPCGIDPDRFMCTMTSDRLAAFRLSIVEPEQLLITYAGRLDLEKGVDTLMNAFASVHAKHPHARLALAGKGLLQEAIHDHIRAAHLQDRVHLLGYLHGETLRAFYAVSDLHVCPSHYEPFGLVAIEAMAAGVPVIVSDVGGLSDIVSTAQVGIRVPPRDVSAWAHALDRMCSQPQERQRMGLAGQRHVRATYAWTGIAQQAVAVYEEAIQKYSCFLSPQCTVAWAPA